jgi:Uma2 family endonuclease
MTAEEFMKLPDDGYRYELINGELERMPPPGFPHGRIQMRLAGPLSQFVWDHDLGEVFGEVGVKLTSNPDTVLAADVTFITKQRLKEAGEITGYWPGPPDVAIEVFSPSDRPSKVKTRISGWFGYGAKQVWIVDPKHCTVTIHRSPSDATTFSGSDYLEAPDFLPGFRISLERIFSTSIQEK